MNVIAWTLFGVINGLMLYAFEGNKEKVSPVGAILMGILGALSGGTAAYLLFGGMQTGLNSTLLLAVFFEAILLYLLLSGKSFRKV